MCKCYNVSVKKKDSTNGGRKMKTKKLVWVEGNSGHCYKMFLHKDANNNHGWHITEDQYNTMCLREPMGWSFDINDLSSIDCKFIHVYMKKEWMEDVLIWAE